MYEVSGLHPASCLLAIMGYVLLLGVEALKVWGLHKPIPSKGSLLEVLLLAVFVAVVTFRRLGWGRGNGVVNDARVLAVFRGTDLGRERLAYELASKLI